MSRDRLLILIGTLVLVSPFVGLPLSILTWILPVLGGLVLGIGISFGMRKKNAQLRSQQISPEIIEQY
ncbi:MAG: hypothetical protein JWL88_429 [Parcubacteria group bacterium]|nr:hypothetical protein [Parcubacteria group bacterium]